MPKVRGIPGDKWTRRAAQATPDYIAGVENPRTDWAAATVAAAPVYGAAVVAAVQRGSYQNGVRAAGTAKWQAKSAGKGAVRYGPGVADAQADYDKAMAPYFAVIEATKLPARGPKGDPANINRVIALNNALRKKKLELQSAGR